MYIVLSYQNTAFTSHRNIWTHAIVWCTLICGPHEISFMFHRWFLQPVTEGSIIQLCQRTIYWEVLEVSEVQLHNFEENECDEIVYVYPM
jgi:hypothetical protein